jgi:hypothetical protein
MATELRYLPHGIPMAPVETSGFAASPNHQSALAPTGLDACARDECSLRGDRIPELIGGYEVMLRAASIAAEQRYGAERKRRLFGSKATENLGYVFHIEVVARIAIPPLPLAAAMARGMAPEVWEALRPHAAEGALHGIDLPHGRIIFRHAQATGHYRETLLTSVPALDLS